MSKDTSAQSNVIVSLSSSEQYRARMFGDARRCACNNHGECAKGDACFYKKAKAALNRAHEIRKFEIDLLWKRAIYVGAFQTLLFAALGASFSFEKEGETSIDILRLTICVVGIFSAFFWYLINKGSKFWHENWEKHIDFLEDEFEGKLHKTVLHKNGIRNYSVSRVNIYISLLFFWTWVALVMIFPFNFLQSWLVSALNSVFDLFDDPSDYFAFVNWVAESPYWAKICLLTIIAIFLCFCRRKLKTKFRSTGNSGEICRIEQELPENIGESSLNRETFCDKISRLWKKIVRDTFRFAGKVVQLNPFSKSYRQRRANRRALRRLRQHADHAFTAVYAKNMRSELSGLCQKYGTDKGAINAADHSNDRVHNYADFYETVFGGMRRQVKSVLECGILRGNSLRVWQEYFPNALITGIDVDETLLFSDNRIETYQVDQTDPASIKRFLAQVKDQQFNVIIDDGLHTVDAAITLFDGVIGNLAADGVYVIEDAKPEMLLKIAEHLARYGGDYAAKFINLSRPNNRLSDDALVVITKETGRQS